MSLNAAWKDNCPESINKETQNSAAGCLESYSKFVSDHADAIAHGWRFSFSGDYVDVKRDTIDAGLPDPIVLDRGHKLLLSAGFGGKLMLGEGEPVSVDLKAEYQDVLGDPSRRDRGVASLTFTRQVGTMSIPFGIVYANHGEFLNDVDARLSAHLGIRFKMAAAKDNP